MIETKGGTMRLGAYQCDLREGTKARALYGRESVMERHRHRFEFTMRYRELFEENGMQCSGINPKSNLVEVVEVRDHPWLVCTQYHPEFKSKPTAPHPLFVGFIKAAIDSQKGKGAGSE